MKKKEVKSIEDVLKIWEESSQQLLRSVERLRDFCKNIRDKAQCDFKASNCDECKELDKLVKAREIYHTEAIGDFLEWLNGQGIILARYNIDSFTSRLNPVHISIEKLLADYTKIDLQRVEKERRELLNRMREANNNGSKTRNN